MTSTIDARKDARDNGTYDVYIDIDVDCEELLDAIGLDYTTSEDDENMNEVKIILDRDEFCDIFETVQLAKANEQIFASRILNPELGEYTTKVSIYTPSGDRIVFK